MTAVLVLGRSRQIVDTVVAMIEDSGFGACGVTTVAAARAALEKGSVSTLVIGAGVDLFFGTRLRRRAEALGVRVIRARPGNSSPQAYVREEVIPTLLHDGQR
ncbi:hypothetical protein [Phytoactinopolyspora mesophila]|uniref:Uncharacterized protein n=1 Tax=Phytoactinopolyspora mesophila TaxID=2650750 RepID=A0A7K3M0R5_9ACTN|nr:hypothetical protein [Phytoactinopolyspora mesophila]NDL56895.1 hypothetical protein [Phytoactinopolyspora mesophila]